jgi:hypothetical protein
LAPAIQAQWLKTSGITVRHLLWLLLALTHVAFAIDPTEPLAELNRTADRAPDGSGTFAQSAGGDLGLGNSSACIALMANITNASTGAIRQGKSGPRLKDRTGRRWDHTAPAERLYYAVTPTSSSGWQWGLARFLPIGAVCCG